MNRSPAKALKGLMHWRLDGWGLVAACAVMVGCRQVQWLGPRQLAPVSDRLKAAYADLESGRFMTIADFERPEQASLFRAEPQPAQVGISVRRSRTQTGAGALRFVLKDRNQRLVADNQRAHGWHLPRDWRDYCLLIMSIYADRPVEHLGLTICSGADLARRFELGGLRLTPGWNLLRIDLAEVSEAISLADVRQLSWHCRSLQEPLELYLDDIILTDNRKMLVGSRDGPADKLFVERRGRRLHVGSAGRFELVFARGKLIRWYDLGRDPQRLDDLAGPAGLGPHLVPLTEPPGKEPIDLAEPAQWSSLGRLTETQMRLLQADPMQVVVQGQRAYFNPPARTDQEQAAASQPTVGGRQRWVYTISPTGRVYVELDASVSRVGWPTPAVGLAVCASREQGFETVVLPASDSVPCATSRFALLARDDPERIDLLWVLQCTADRLEQRTLLSHDQRQVAALIIQPRPPAAQAHWAAMLTVWPAELDSLADALPLVADYCRPAEPQVRVGALVRNDPGDFNNDGFNESRGYYSIALDGGLARFSFNRPGQLRFYPTFKLYNSAGRQCWVYVDGRLIQRTWRDRQGRLLFQIDRIIDKPVTVEAVCSPTDQE